MKYNDTYFRWSVYAFWKKRDKNFSTSRKDTDVPNQQTSKIICDDFKAKVNSNILAY